MNPKLLDSQDKSYDKSFGFVRLILLVLFLWAILNNRNDQTNHILIHFPEIESASSTILLDMKREFSAANTLSLMFVVMQLIILYVGTNRFRFWHSIFSIFGLIIVLVIHAMGITLYFSHNRWQYQNIWVSAILFCALPTFSEILVALYTAKS